MSSQCHGLRKSLTVQLNSRPMRRIELDTEDCTVVIDENKFCRVSWVIELHFPQVLALRWFAVFVMLICLGGKDTPT